jgi:hypothetical protein
MAIEKTYKVHSAVMQDVDMPAMIGSRQVVAKVPGLVVELSEVDGTQGHTFPFFPASDQDLTEIRALFVTGATISVIFTQGTDAS